MQSGVIQEEIFSISHYKYCLNRLCEVYIAAYSKVYSNTEIDFGLDLLVTPFFKVTHVGFADGLFVHTFLSTRCLVNYTQQMAKSFTIMQIQYEISMPFASL